MQPRSTRRKKLSTSILNNAGTGRGRRINLLVLAPALLLTVLALNPLQGQITSPAAGGIRTLTYTDSPGQHPLFVFYQTGETTVPGTLTATLPGAGTYTFQWSRYNPSLPGFAAPFLVETAQASSTASGLDEGGYRVRIFDGTGTDTLLYAWVMLDELGCEVTQTAAGTLPAYMYTCYTVTISGQVAPDTLWYYDPFTHRPEFHAGGYSFEWTSDNEDLDIPNDNSILRNNTSYAPPYKDTWYVLTATDNLGMTVKDSVFYESIQTRATFRMEYWDKVALAWDGDLTSTWTKDQGSLDAPLTVRFRNESLNGVQFDWTLLDTLGGIPVTDVTTDTSQFVEFVYRTANKYYYPTLVSTSEEACTDTFELESPLFVAPSQLAIPNVFSPNGDLANDIWYFKHQSLQSCKVTVVDRTGKIMYRKKIDDIYLWEGWDGNVHETNRKAPEGQYYYIVEALGYDGVEYKDPTIIENWRTNRGGSATTGGTGTDGETAAQTVYTGWLYLFRGVGEY